MNKIFVDQWNKRKDKLEEWFKSLEDSYISYEDIVKKLFELVITEGHDEYSSDGYNINNLVTIDHGHYQGTQIFIIPLDTYQPSSEDYVFLDNYYGSCSGCDTLLSIVDFHDGKFDEQQVKDLMTLSLHLVQGIKLLNKEE